MATQDERLNARHLELIENLSAAVRRQDAALERKQAAMGQPFDAVLSEEMKASAAAVDVAQRELDEFELLHGPRLFRYLRDQDSAT